MSKYNMPPLGLFGKRCKIPTGIYGEPFIYRIVNDGINSNSWCEVPLMGYSNPAFHNNNEEILIVVSDDLIDDNSRLIRVAKKDVEIMDENKQSTIYDKDKVAEKHENIISQLENLKLHCMDFAKDGSEVWKKDCEALDVAIESLKSDHVIRCKDCEFWTKISDSLQGRCCLNRNYPTGEWFCGNARLREKE